MSGISFHICLHILPAYHTVSARINAEPFFSIPLTHVLYRLFVRHLFSHMFAHLACLPYRICINQCRFFSAPLTHVLYRLFVRHLFSHMFAHLACQPHRICINQCRALPFSPSHTRACTLFLPTTHFYPRQTCMQKLSSQPLHGVVLLQQAQESDLDFSLQVW